MMGPMLTGKDTAVAYSAIEVMPKVQFNCFKNGWNLDDQIIGQCISFFEHNEYIFVLLMFISIQDFFFFDAIVW